MDETTTAEAKWTTAKRRLAELWWQVKIADNALQLGKDKAEFEAVARGVRGLQKQTYGEQLGEDEMGDVSVGNTYTITGGGESKPNGIGTAAKIAALLAAGTIGGAAVHYLAADDPSAPPPPFTDTDTKTDIAFPE